MNSNNINHTQKLAVNSLCKELIIDNEYTPINVSPNLSPSQYEQVIILLYRCIHLFPTNGSNLKTTTLKTLQNQN